MSSAWKVAYADFVTALMAFFLLNAGAQYGAAAETKQGLAEYFAEEATLQTSSTSPISNNSLVNATLTAWIRATLPSPSCKIRKGDPFRNCKA